MSIINKRSKLNNSDNNVSDHKMTNNRSNNSIVVYHEKQIKELCALHALNNLFQRANAFTKQQLDEICHQLSPNVWINPHKSLLGLGNYDINVIMKALQLYHNYETIWFDKRKDPNCLNLNNIFGFILNVPTDYRFGFVLLPLKRRHWIAIKQINGYYYNLDSKLDTPMFIGQNAELITYLKEQLECRDKELFIVVTHDVEQLQNWQYQSTNSTTAQTQAHIVKLSDTEQYDVDDEMKLNDDSDYKECDNENDEERSLCCVTMNPLCNDNNSINTNSNSNTSTTNDSNNDQQRTFKPL